MSRELVAKQELDKAEVRLRKNSDLVRQLTELLKDALSGANMSLSGSEKYVEINSKRYTEIELDDYIKKVGLANGLVGIADDYADGQKLRSYRRGRSCGFRAYCNYKIHPCCRLDNIMV